VPEESFWTLWCKGRLTADHPAGHHSIRTNQCPPPPSPIFYRPDANPAVPPNQQCQSTEGNKDQKGVPKLKRSCDSAYGPLAVITVARDHDSDSENCYILVVLFMPSYVIGQAIIFFALWFLLSIFFPRLISAAADWMPIILPHMVWP